MNDRPFPDRPKGERMTEGQIEDVLSSIRRLVSDEALAEAVAAAPSGPAPLILTSAHRVIPANPDMQAAVAKIGAAMPDDAFESDTGDEAPTVALRPSDDAPMVEPLLLTQHAAPVPSSPVPPSPVPPSPVHDPAWVDRAEAEVIAALEAEEEALPTPMPTDEAALRALIRDVLREELQGRMGERITTNVRKLVRAEINRLIALHDADGR
jgi:hypothetical protein